MGRLAALVLLFCALPAAAAEDPAAEGFQHLFNLEYDEALAVFRRLAAQDPDNPEYQNDIAATILYRELFRAGALESELVSGTNPFLRRPKMHPSPADQEAFRRAVTRSLELTAKRLEKNPNDIDALYFRGSAFAIKANWDFLVRKAWLDALRGATQSRKLHQKILKLDPGYIDARLIPGIHEYVVGSLPWYWKLLGFLAGFRGNKAQGIRMIELVAREGDRQRDNARFLLAAIYRRERRPADAIPLLEGLIRDFPRNYLLRMELVQMYSDLGDKQKALAVVREIERLKKEGAPGYGRMPWHKLWYTRGTLLFWYMDLEQALADFRKLVGVADELPLHQAQLAWFRLGQTLDLLGRRAEALGAYRKAIALAPQSERARQARRYLKSPCTVKTRK